MSLKFWTHMPFHYPDIDRPYADLLSEMIDIAQASEELGYEGISIPEVQFSNFIINPSALQIAAVVAAKTTRLKILTGVLVLPHYHPLALAGEVALADQIAAGRLSVGVARGGNQHMPERLGVDPSKLREMYEESFDILLRAWTEDDITHAGRFWNFPETTVLPRPFQKPHPKLWVAAQSENGLRAAGLKGQNIMTSPNLGSFAPHGDLEKALEIYEGAVAEAGVERGEVLVFRHTFIAETDGEALRHLEEAHRHWGYYMSQYTNPQDSVDSRFAERGEHRNHIVGGQMTPVDIEIERDDVFTRYDDPILVGPEKAIERFKHYERLGVDHIAGATAMGASVDEVIKSMEVVATQVMPEFD